ncbi:hypothetical protein QBC43DRAFT_296957 [Cladorrhinum sp. PSN259]|nr:hypothetical protein QBC43DRAFT_296957 [Cladorrhinum sp. PSN259]
MLSRPRNVTIFVLLLIVVFLLFKSPSKAAPASALQYLKTLGGTYTEISNATLGFEQIFVINLPERTDRRDAFTLAAALTDVAVTWIDGVAGQHVLDKTLPSDSLDKNIPKGNKGSWRAHMNALQRIVQQDIASALILEDDADWDIRIKPQLQIFAQAAQAFTQRRPGQAKQTFAEQLQAHGMAEHERNVNKLPYIVPPRLSPYGDDWDVLWLGHCGTEIPTESHSDPYNMLGLKVIIADDVTVPAPKHLKPHPFALQDDLAELYPPQTRVVHAARNTTCTQAYAVSQRGARKLLWQFGLQTFTTGWDLMLGDWCDGFYSKHDPDSAGSVKQPVCVTVSPPLFSHHYGKGAASDITAPGGGFINKGKEMTPYVRLSVRMNMEKMVNGAQLEDLVDQWED